MGRCPSKNTRSYACVKELRLLIQKERLLQQEINVVLKQREEEHEAYKREMMVFAFKEAKWRREQKKLQEEVKRLQRSLEMREERIKEIEEKREISESTSCRASLLLVQEMREERARQDETLQKWKMLYLATKNELDDLIQRTHQGALYWRADEEDLMEELQQELKVKDETIQLLKAQIASTENEEYKRKREVDILRQSLKIISSKNGISSETPVVKSPSKPTFLAKSLTKLACILQGIIKMPHKPCICKQRKSKKVSQTTSYVNKGWSENMGKDESSNGAAW